MPTPRIRIQRCLLLPLILITSLVLSTVRAGIAGSFPEQKQPLLNCFAAILVEWHTGTILFQQNAFERVHPASLTKMMTGLLALERGRLEDVVRVSRLAASQPGSSMHLEENDAFTLEDLLYGLMLNSGNDAAWAIAEHIGETAGNFFRMMNKRAREIGAINTRFANPHGLTDPNHYTTAFDLTLIAKTCLRHPYFNHLIATKEKDVIEADKGVKTALCNTNRLLWMYVGADGVKTGTTESAGQCLVASATRNGMRLLAVVLDSGDRWSDAANLLEFGFAEFRLARFARAGETLLSLPTRGSFSKTAPVVCAGDLSACVPRYATGLSLEVDLPKAIRAPHAAGTVVGKVCIRLGQNVVGSCDLVLGEWVSARTPVSVLVRFLTGLAKRLVSSGVL